MNMIEKVARAIFASEGMVYTDDERMFEPYPYDELDEIEKASFEHKAKGAIEAMRDDLKAHLKYDEEGVIDRIDAVLEEK